MKRARILFILCLLACLQACHLEPLPVPKTSSAYVAFSRALQEGESLEEGSVALFHATGGLQLVNQLFTYDGINWGSGQSFSWTDTQITTDLVVLYPVYSDLTYTAEQLYAEGELDDVLIARQTLAAKAPIELTFNHLFSKLTIQVDETLQADLLELKLTTPVKVASVSPSTGEINLLEESFQTIRNASDTGEYTFLVPPMESNVLTLCFVWNNEQGEQIHEQLLPFQTFQSGYEYVYNLVYASGQVGIRTAEDLIAFSLLYNNKEYNGNKSLSDFGKMENGKMVYRLLADIELTETESSRLWPVGYYEDRAFNQIFDGGGYCISNLVLPEENTIDKTTGLFGYIAQAGEVRNLHLESVTSSSSTSSKYVGAIAGKSEGVILNCSVRLSELYAAESGNVGLICSRLISGDIVNCFTSDNTLHVPVTGKAGAISADANGRILNCYTRSNLFSDMKKDNFCAGIVGSSSEADNLWIENCCVNYGQTKSSYWAAAVGLTSNVELHYFYTNQTPLVLSGSLTNYTEAYKYNSSNCVGDVPIVDMLNNWVENVSPDKAYGYQFRRWQVKNNAVVFEE